jgi:hypothetical protein
MTRMPRLWENYNCFEVLTHWALATLSYSREGCLVSPSSWQLHCLFYWALCILTTIHPSVRQGGPTLNTLPFARGYGPDIVFRDVSHKKRQTSTWIIAKELKFANDSQKIDIQSEQSITPELDLPSSSFACHHMAICTSSSLYWGTFFQCCRTNVRIYTCQGSAIALIPFF